MGPVRLEIIGKNFDFLYGVSCCCQLENAICFIDLYSDRYILSVHYNLDFMCSYARLGYSLNSINLAK